jgi:RHS repeat-associated protein
VVDNGNDRVQQFGQFSTPGSIVAPNVSGEMIEGQTLTAGTGIWAASPAATYTYQWQRCNSAGASCTNVSGATSATYTLGGGDTGYRIRVMVKATNTAGSTEAASPAVERTAGPHTTEYAYDGDGNVERVTDPNGHTTHYVYNADNERTKVEEPNGTVTETGYDGAGQVGSQTNGNKQKTEYVRNALEQVTEVIDPLSRKTTKEYDAAGNLTSVTDAAKRTTTYKYDPANRLTEVSYSDGKTPTVTYEYGADGNRTKMTDGTGTTTYTYDKLDRLTESKDGHGDLIKYGYDLANEQTKITYPNGKTVERAYDKAGRLEKVTDWLEHTTKFSYNADSKLTAVAFPTGTSEEDTYAYNNADQMTEVKMSKGTEALASLSYARDNGGQVQRSVDKGLPGKETLEYAYDENNRLAKGAGTAYGYDAANDPTTIGSGEYKYDSASELETGPGVKYTYNELGERTKTTPTSGPASTYGYDQAGNLTSVERPKEGEVAKIEDTYAYNGDGLRASEAISGTTHYLAWDTSEELPLILNDGTDSYVYGPEGVPVEQINGEEKAQYLHHDQEGSTRLITSSTGIVEGAYTYTPYGAVEGHTGTATTALGYDSQYTSSDTGLIYLRAREYDPVTAQFMSVDPAVETTLEPYVFVEDDPLGRGDATGMCAEASASSFRRGRSKEDCEDLLGEIAYKVKELHRRYNQLFHNPKKLTAPEVKEYVKTFNEKQKALKDEVRQFGAWGCDKKSYGLQLPAELHEAEEVKVSVRIRVEPY